MGIRPEYLTFNNVLNQRLYRIPNYQRAYSWESKQREELFSDILKLNSYKDQNRHHFMATIVCLQRNIKEELGTDEFYVLDVVDGQQRLTTLIILLKALSKKLARGTDNEKNESLKIEKLLVKGDNRLILLQTNHDRSHTFANYLKHGTKPEEKRIKTIAEKNLYKAFQECEAFVEGWANEFPTIELLKIVKNRLDFIFYVLEEEGSVYTVFEVLNSRGLEVDWLDKCKSMLMGIAFDNFEREISEEHISELHKYWTNVYSEIGLQKMPGYEILKFAGTLIYENCLSKPLSTEKTFEFFRDECTQDPNKVTDISKWILDVTSRLKDIYSNPRLSAVTSIAHARLLAVAISLSPVLDEDEIDEVLQAWERVTFRIFGLCRRDSRTKVGDYTKLAYGIINDELTKEEILTELQNIGAAYPIDKAVKELQLADCYNGWEKEVRYFLYRYEEYLAEKQGVEISSEMWEQIWQASASSTIEHIHPQKMNEAWKHKISNRQDIVDKHVDRIGNLILLPPNLNSKASGKNFRDKKAIYRQNYLRMMDEILNKGDWNRGTIEQREQHLIHWAKKTWGEE